MNGAIAIVLTILAAFMVLGQLLSIARAGKPRENYAEGGPLVFALLLSFLWLAAVIGAAVILYKGVS